MITALSLALLRSLLIAGVLALLAPSIERAVGRHRWLWLPLVAPLLLPSLVLGYTYAEVCGNAWFGELAYSLLLALRLLPLAVLVQVLLPAPGLSAAARHCASLASCRPPGTRLPAARNASVVAGLVGVLALQEFELASLCNRPSWTVWLFDAQTGGLPLGETLWLASAPVVSELLILGLVLWIFLRRYRQSGDAAAAEPSALGIAWPLLAAGLLVVLPLLVLSPGLARLGGQLHLGTELWNSLVLSAAAVACTMILLASCPTPLLAVLSLPGLLGGLVLGLCLQALFQLPGLAFFYDSPLPLVLGWTLLLLPMGLVLRLASRRWVADASLHLSGLLAASASQLQRRNGRRLEFALIGLKRAMVAAVLFLWAFFEVALGDLLAPSNMTPVAPRLYNLMHYGQSAGLSAMVWWMTLTALLCSGLALLSARFYQRVRVHAC